MVAVEGDDVARARVRAADHGVAALPATEIVVDADPIHTVAQGTCAGDVCADEVALNSVADTEAVQEHTRKLVPGNDVARARSGPSHGHMVRTEQVNADLIGH